MIELKRLGLTKYEIEVYLCLVKNGTLTGTKIFNISKVPHGKVYESLVKLEEKELITVTNSKPKEYTALDPNLGLEKLAKSKISDIKEDTVSTIKNLQDLKSLNPVKNEIRETIKLSAGKKEIFSNVLNMYNRVQKEMKEIITYEDRPHTHIRAVKNALSRGVKVKFLITKKPIDLDFVKKDLALGVELRYYPIDELRFVIMDSKECIQTLINPRDKRDRVCIYVMSDTLSTALNFYFDELWKKAEIIK